MNITPDVVNGILAEYPTRAELHIRTPRYDILKLHPVANPGQLSKMIPRIAIAMGVSDAAIRFGWPLENMPGTAYLEIPHYDFIAMDAVAQLSSLRKIDLARMLTEDALIFLGNGRHPAFVSLRETPHFLVAGTTGSGKSVLLRHMINHLITHTWRTAVSLIDHKGTEFTDYEVGDRIRHVVLSDHEASISVIDDHIALMEERFKAYAELHVKDIDGYAALADQNGLIVDPRQDAVLKCLGSKVATSVVSDAFHYWGDRRVIVIDEFADMLMSTGSKATREALIEKLIRLAQKGRAAGIHLIIATQRPSVDVMPGILKANIPGRIALRCASAVNAAIIDVPSAERLSGKGDGIVISATGEEQRFQSPLVSQNDMNLVRSSLESGIPNGWLAVATHLNLGGNQSDSLRGIE